MTGPCLVEVEWEGRATRERGAIALVASGEPECRIGACGSCIYDFSFEVPDVDPSTPVEMGFALEICRELHDPEIEFVLPLDEGASGTVCRQIDASAGPIGDCGAPHQACCESDPPRMCAEGLECRGAEGGSICLTPCEGDGDCPLSEFETCKAGVCQVSTMF